MKFREATMEDLATLRTLEQCVVEAERPFNEAIKEGSPRYYDIEDLITNERSLLLVAEDQGAIVGTGYVQIRASKQSLQHEEHAYLGFMYVAPEYRGQGLNAKLMNQLMDWSKERGIRDFYLDVYADNAAAVRAYEKAGFKPSLLEMKLHK